MAKNKDYYKFETRNSSGKKCKNDTPGQFHLEIIDADLRNIIKKRDNSEKLDIKKPSCTPEQAKEYWESFMKFLKCSGFFARAWHLYNLIKSDPDVAFLRRQLERRDLTEAEKAEYNSQLKRALDHLDNMKTRLECESVEELRDKIGQIWEEYEKVFDRFLKSSKKAGISFDPDDETKEAVMLYFVLLDDEIRGNCRREFYKERYVTRALKSIKKTGYFEPVSFEEIETAFIADKAYQEKYLARRRK